MPTTSSSFTGALGMATLAVRFASNAPLLGATAYTGSGRSQFLGSWPVNTITAIVRNSQGGAAALVLTLK